MAYRSLEDGNHGDGNEDDATTINSSRHVASTCQAVNDDSGGRVDDDERVSNDDLCDLVAQADGGGHGPCGPRGLLSVDKVKPLLFLVCVVQVRLACKLLGCIDCQTSPCPRVLPLAPGRARNE